VAGAEPSSSEALTRRTNKRALSREPFCLPTDGRSIRARGRREVTPSRAGRPRLSRSLRVTAARVSLTVLGVTAGRCHGLPWSCLGVTRSVSRNTASRCRGNYLNLHGLKRPRSTGRMSQTCIPFEPARWSTQRRVRTQRESATEIQRHRNSLCPCALCGCLLSVSSCWLREPRWRCRHRGK
jgi:hypothetical protein